MVSFDPMSNEGRAKVREGASMFLGLLGGVASIGGGAMLLTMKSAAAVSGDLMSGGMLDGIAHGIGIYCIGKGVWMLGRALAYPKAQPAP